MVEKVCPNCGALTVDGDFCPECGTRLITKSDGFCSILDERISLSSLIFSFIILGIFLFIGSLFWGIFASNGTIGFSAHVMLTVLFAIFFGGIFVGYVNCLDDTCIIPNFFVYFGTILASVLCGVGIVFTVVSAFASSLSSLFSSSPMTSSYGGGTDTNIVSSFASNFILEIFILILLIPAAAYLGIYAGFLIKKSIN